MKVTLRLIISLMVAVGLVAYGFAYWQAHQESTRLKNELEKRAAILADSLNESVQPLLASQMTTSLSRIVNKFSNRERISGVSIHNTQSNIVVASSSLEPQLKAFPGIIENNVHEVERNKMEFGCFTALGKMQVHAYSIPVLINEKVEYILTIFHNTSYIQERVWKIWINSFWRALTQVLVIALITLILVYLNVMTPIRRTTEWIKKIRLGESPEKLNPRDQILLGPLADEISKMAKTLEMARLSAEKEARLRMSSESIWTPDRLKEFIKKKLEDKPLYIVSNREPYMHMRKGKEIECIVPASGLVTALEPILKACEGTWIAQGSGDADKDTVDKNDKLRVPPEEPQYYLKRIWIEKKLDEGFYSGFSNEGLWPLCHIAHTRPIFREKDWQSYQEVNRQFSDAVVKEIEGVSEPYILIQDYHFALLPRLIQEKRPDAKIAIFWHIPWPNPESFGICPWRRELLEGMLGADIIGFHTQFHCNNFIETIDRFLESRIDYEHFTVHRDNKMTWVKPFPISIAFTGELRKSNNLTVVNQESKESLLKKHGLEAEFIGVGVDRLDYTKGILERFLAVENFLDNNPQYVGRFTFVELGAPSRTMIPKYHDFIADIEKETSRINTRFQTKKWQPILLLKKHHSHADIAPFYKCCDVCLVTSLHDGMNLVAKEFVMARNDEKGVLILSQFTGAASELTDALIVNPYDIRQCADAIKTALNMSLEEQREKMIHMRNVLKDRNIYRWASELVNELIQVRRG